MSTVPPMEDPDNLARVGTEEAGFPEGGEPSQSNESASQAKKNAWPSSAKEELDKFKGVPVVGGLPWRTQYLVLAGVLALSLLGLMGLLTRGGDAAPNPGAVVQARESVKQITTQVDLLARGGVADPAILAEAQKRGGAAAKPLGAGAEWDSLSKSIDALAPGVESSRQFQQNAGQSRHALIQGLTRALPLFEQAKREGLAWSPEGVALAQVIGHYQTLVALLDVSSIEQGWEQQVLEATSQVSQGFEGFKTSASAGQDTSLTRAWRELSAAWGQSTPTLEAARSHGRSLLATEPKAATVKTAAAAFSQAIDGRASGGASQSSLPALLVGLVALTSLALLLWVAWKQHKWQILNIQAGGEQNDQAILDMMEDLEAIGNGDLTRRARVSESPIGTLSDTINKTVEQLRKMISASKKSTAETMQAAIVASEATGIVIDDQRDRLATLEGNSQDILKLIEAVSAGASDATVSTALAEQAQSTAQSGHGAVFQSLDKMREAMARVDEASSRTQRLVASSNEIAGMAMAMKEIAEQLEILGMQAAMQAVKAGESGQGFKVVAKGVQELAEASGQRARNVSLLVETALSDLEALSASMASATQMVEESSSLTDVSHQAWQEVSDQLESLLERVRLLREKSKDQEDLAELLDKRTRKELGQAELSSRQTQEASEAIGRLFSSVQSMEQAVSRFKA